MLGVSDGPSCASNMGPRRNDSAWTTFTSLSRQMGKRFRVVVLDARPHNEGRALLRCLLEAGLCASYCLLNAAAYIISEVTKVRGQPRPLGADMTAVQCAPRSRPHMHQIRCHSPASALPQCWRACRSGRLAVQALCSAGARKPDILMGMQPI